VTIDAGTITWLIVGAVLLGALAVVIDRVNFPQKPFRPKRIETGERGAARDRTGAHIVEDHDDVPEGSPDVATNQSPSGAEGEVTP